MKFFRRISWLGLVVFGLISLGYYVNTLFPPTYVPEPDLAGHVERFDPALADSIQTYSELSATYKQQLQQHGIADTAHADKMALLYMLIAKRFYHTVSEYSLRHHPLAYIVSFLWTDIRYPVIQEDILAYPHAFCSQQGALFMQLAQEHGYRTRVAALDFGYSGHYVPEVFYNNSWHFYDTDMEPAHHLELAQYAADSLMNQPIFRAAYQHYYNNTRRSKPVVPSLEAYHPENDIGGHNMRLLHRLLWWVGYLGWVPFALSLLLTRKRAR